MEEFDGDDLYRLIRKHRIEDAELQISRLKSEEKTIMIDNKLPKRTQISNDESIIVKCIRKGKLATIISSDIKELDSLIEKVYSLAEAIGSEEHQKHFYDKRRGKLRQIGKYNDERMNINGIIKYINQIDDDKVYTIDGIIEQERYSLSSANSYGLRVDLNDSSGNFEFNVIAKEGNEQATGGEEGEFKAFESFDFQRGLDLAISIAKSMLGAKPAPTTNGKLLLDQRAVIDLLASLFPALNGEAIVKKMSFLNDLLNKEVAGENISVYEKPYLPNGFYNRKFDDEMVPTKEKWVIKEGILKSYFNTVYSAEKMHLQPSGNNFELTFGEIRPTNLILKNGNYSYEEMIKNIDKGIYMIQTGDSPNTVSGDLSAMVLTGYYVENGEIKYPVKETMIGGNLLQMLKNVEMISKDTMTRYGITAPRILISDVKISGK